MSDLIDGDLVDRVTHAMMRVNEHIEGFTYSQLIREMAIVAVAICGKGTPELPGHKETVEGLNALTIRK